MSAETLQVVTLSLQIVNAIAVPALMAIGRHLWRVEKRLLTIELHMGLHKRQTDA